jgi:hypothetical protein
MAGPGVASRCGLPKAWPPSRRRGDGTLSYFFSTQDLAARAEAAGLQVEEAEYACVCNTNRKTGQQLRRVFVHGVFSRPRPAGLIEN